MSRPPFHGSCLCGKVAFEVNAAPITISTCHCKNCKKYTGTVFTTNVVVPADSINVTKGEELVKTYHDTAQDSGNAIPRHFCSECGSPLFNTKGDFGKTAAVFYGALDDLNIPGGDECSPEVEYYAKDRLSWMHPLQGAIQASTKPGRE